MSEVNIGILGIQGAYEKHALAVELAGVKTEIIKYREQLDQIDGLILPGGESTTMSKVMGFRISFDDIFDFAKRKPVFGTCAGLILLGKGIDDHRVKQFELMDVTVTRNAYGSQKDSFVDNIKLNFDPENPFHAVFIRAPQIEKIGDDIRVLASCDGKPVMVESNLYLGVSFHPELTRDPRIHKYFVQKIMEVNNGKALTSA
ncbi:MAG: pyridoxal 5'-phosphate synthase glutaminase subunit PdxT [Candidatus Marinimicrobia bacterium]|nr:pyridoxal 5'-phosphate synthase glutaminase subunit PdxT [Candidatus Neomarinimicrobiota bacterium]